MEWTELALELVLMPLVAFVVGMAMVLMMRKIAAKLQRRIGPPLLQPLYDIVKLHSKETQVSHGLIHEIGIVMAIGGYVAAETLLPVPGMNGIAAQGGLIALLYMTMIPSLGLALGVGQCANPNGSIGISRALTAMMAYDVPLVIVIFGVATHYGTINLVDMIAVQQAGGPATWGVPRCRCSPSPGSSPCKACSASTPSRSMSPRRRSPPAPWSRWAASSSAGSSSCSASSSTPASVLYVTLFLGGGENWATFLLKSFAVLAIPVSIAMVFPRYRTEDLVRLLWKWPVMLGLLGLAFIVR